MLSSVLEAIKTRHPQSHIHCLIKPAYAAVLASHPCVDSVIPYEGFWSTLAVLRRMHWDALLDLHGTLRTRLLSFLTAARKRAVYEKNAAGRRLLLLFKQGRNAGESVLNRYMKAAFSLGLVDSIQASHRLPAPKTDTEDTINFLMKMPDSAFTVGFAPGARWATKRWLPERFAELARMIKANYPQCRFILVGADEDKAACSQIAGMIAEFHPLNMAGSLSVAELMRVISKCSLFVTNDSGPMHIASGYGVPTVAVFGPTVRGFGFYPQGPKSRVVEADLDCRPCSLHGGDRCPRGHFLCMRLTGASEVFKACQEVMKK